MAALAEEQALVPTPVVYSLQKVFQRLRLAMRPGHAVQRRWLKKGRAQGYVSVPFAPAVRSVLGLDLQGSSLGALGPSDVTVCLIGRREMSDTITKAWQERLESLPFFEILGEAATPEDLDPVEPPWGSPLSDLMTDEEMLGFLLDQRSAERMAQRFFLPQAELEERAKDGKVAARILREVVAGLPKELLKRRDEEEVRLLVRSTVRELLKLLWTIYSVTNVPRLRWRFACVDDDAADPKANLAAKPFGLRAYFILAGEGLEFVPAKFVDQAEVAAAARTISPEDVGRMRSEDWVKTVTYPDTNLTAALKRVPPGWTTLMKGERWPEMPEGGGALYRMPSAGKRLLIQVDADPAGVEEAKAPETPEAEEDETTAMNSSSWLGPLAGVVAALVTLAKQSPPFVEGRKRRREVDQLGQALARQPSSGALVRAEEALAQLETRAMRSDFGQDDEAPSVLVLGGKTPTGQVVCQKLVMRGFHVTILGEAGGRPPTRVLKELPQGSVLISSSVEASVEPVHFGWIPQDIYDAVAGIDKFVIVNCDTEAECTEQALVRPQAIKNALACWQMYRRDFAEAQRSYSSKVQIFSFDRETDFALWDLERKNPTDTCYGLLSAGWVRSFSGNALFIGGFLEPVGQCTLSSPTLKLNFKRFSGIIMNVYNQARKNKYSFFLRTSDFELTRVQYEFDFTCDATRWYNVRMPFNAFRAIRADGMQLPKEDGVAEKPLERADVVQMGIVVRTSAEAAESWESQLRTSYGSARTKVNKFSLQVHFIKVFRTQNEPQVVYLGRRGEHEVPSPAVSSGAKASPEAEEEEEEEEEITFTDEDADMEKFARIKRKAEEEAKQDIVDSLEEKKKPNTKAIVVVEEPSEEVDDTEGVADLDFFFRGFPKSPQQAIIESGLAFTMVQVNAINAHASGKHHVSVRQASLNAQPLSVHQGTELGSVSRGDAAEIAVAAILEPSCVNAELAIGEPREGDDGGAMLERFGQASDLLASSFEISSAVGEEVKKGLKLVKPNN